MTPRHAVIVEAPRPPGGPSPHGDLALWQALLAAALREAGHRVTLLRPILAGAAEAARDALVVAAPEPRALSVAVDAALRRLAPEIVHAPERGGALLAALYARAAGEAHRGARLVLHARGPTRLREEERGRFLGTAAELLLDAQERRALELADLSLTCCAGVAAWLAEAGWPVPLLAAPELWRLPAPPEAREGRWEWVIPGPLDGAEGLEFLVAALRRSRPAARIAVFGEPGEMALDEPARLVASLGDAVTWDAPEGEALRHLSGGARRVALLGARRTAPPELLAACIAAGIPVLARRNAAIEAWAARHPGRIEILPEGERPFAAALAAWASFAPSAGGEAAPPLPDSAALRARGPDASLVPLPNPLPPVVAAAAQGRWVLDQGRIRVAQPGMAAALLRAALASGRPVATCAASPGALPLGPEPDLAFLDPGATLGEAVLLDGEACRALGAPGKAVLAALGTPALPAAIAAAGLRVIALPAPLHEPLPPREVPEGERLALAAPAFPEALRDGLRLLLPPPPRATFADPHEEALARPLDRADRDGPDGPRHLARLLETLGHFDAALDAWAELRRRAPHDEEALVAQAALRFRRHGVPPDEAAVAQLRRAKRLHVLDAALGDAMVGSARLGERPIPPAPPDEDEDTDAGEGP